MLSPIGGHPPHIFINLCYQTALDDHKLSNDPEHNLLQQLWKVNDDKNIKGCGGGRGMFSTVEFTLH